MDAPFVLLASESTLDSVWLARSLIAIPAVLPVFAQSAFLLMPSLRTTRVSIAPDTTTQIKPLAYALTYAFPFPRIASAVNLDFMSQF